MAGRPREFDRNDALVKARNAFWARGYEGTSMADLVSALGIASARIYAAFGSKADLFREAIGLYEIGEGGFATRALEADAHVRIAIERMFRDAITLYTQPGKPLGCMVVSAATNCSSENEEITDWLAEHRRARTASIIDRLRKAVRAGELHADADVTALGDLLAALLHGISIQARDRVPKKRLLALIQPALQMLDQACIRPKSAPPTGRNR